MRLNYASTKLGIDVAGNDSKGFGVGDGKIGKDFAIEDDAFFGKITDETTISIGGVNGAEGGVDADDPKGAEVALAIFATLEGVV